MPSPRQRILLSALLIISSATVMRGDIYPLGDITEDHVVDFRDVHAFAEWWLDESCITDPGCAADLNGADGVDGFDFAILAQNWLERGMTVVINEFMASNSSSEPLEDWELLDEDGDSSDWIELYNPTDVAIDISGWYLTDDVNDLTEWQLPAGLTLGPGQFLIVFASGKNRAVLGSELHTDFQLDADQPEYLALVESDGTTIAHEYSPRYPEQLPNISYGLAQYATSLVAPGGTASYHVPTAGDAGKDWPALDFDDGSWSQGASGFGFGNATAGFSVTYYKAATTVSTLAIAEQVIADSGLQSSQATEIAPYINYLNTSSYGNYADDAPFPSTVIGNDIEDFVILATGMVEIPSTGNWTFGVNSDDGFSLELTRGSDSFMISYPNPRGSADTLGTFNITQAGTYSLRLVFYERGGGSEVELFAAQGSYSAFNATAFDLVGDVANGGLAVSSYGNDVSTDVQSVMQNINASLWTRFTFQAEETDFYDSLSLQMKYEDGFIAYLNGVEVARSNFAGVPGWNSQADSDRSGDLTMTAQTFDISSHLGLLREGGNVLAVQGLNDSAANGSFLVQPELIAASNETVPQYLAEATPNSFNTSGSANRVVDTTFSHDRGFYESLFYVTIETETPGATIMYTRDGSVPTETHGLVYSGPVLILGTTCLRAMAYKPGWMSTNVDTHTYIFLGQVIQQSSAPSGFPTTWGSEPTDYEMDPDVVYNALYSGEIKSDLLALPTMSIVMNVDELFGSGGIYPNWGSSGVAWERACSVELFYGDGTTGFQEDCGIRIYGGVGRREQKKTFRLLFKRQYGPTKLRYDLFDYSDAVDEFDTIILRAGFNNSWHGVYDRSPQYIRDEWVRRSQLDMDQPGLHGNFVHLYVNGLYWGVYNPTERANADFGSSYLGGDKEEYDALNSYPRNIVDGTADAWVAAQSIAAAGVADQAGYDALAEYVDIDNLIDYMILNFYGGNQDWDDHNWYTVRHRVPGAGWKFISWDSERVLEDITGHNRVSISQADKPSYLYSALRQNAEFRMKFADRAYKLFFHDGALTEENAQARYQMLADLMYAPIVCESARWGDNKSTTPRTRNVEWVAERDRLLNSYFPQRTQVTLGFLKAAGLYPTVDAPEFYVDGSPLHGGQITSSQQLSIDGAGTVYYTTDGNDPRAPVAFQMDDFVLIQENAVKRAFVPTADIGTAWRSNINFDDSTWKLGGSSNGALSFDGLDDYVRTDKTASNLGIGGTHAKTVSAWAYTRTFNGGGIFEMGTHAEGQDFSLRTLGSDNDWRVQCWGSADIDFTTGSKDTWTHFVLAYDGSRLRVYVNGQLQADEARSLNTADEYPFAVGRWSSYYFDGIIDDVRIYNVSLSSSQVQTLAANGDVTTNLVAHWKLDETSGTTAYDSAGANDGEVSGGAQWIDSDREGPAGVGYEANPTSSPNYTDLIGIDVSEMEDNMASCYVRIPFTVDAETLSQINYMTLQARYDDGFVAFLNGTQVLSRNFTNTLVWNSNASTSHADSAAILLEDSDISTYINLLQPGENLLAIHGLNISTGSSDFVFSCKLIAGESTAPDDIVTPTAIEYTGPFVPTESMHIKARVLAGSVWSAMSEAGFSVGPVAENLRITELMYHPAETGDPNDPNAEYIELKNIGTESINLNRVRFTNGVDFMFGSTILGPEDYVLVVRDMSAFEQRYGSGLPVVGQYSGSLDNGGERVVLEDASGYRIHDFRYKDGWYGITDGKGFSLTVLDEMNPDPNVWDDKDGWRPSALPGGSPGVDDSGVLPDPGSVVINEVLAHSHDTLPDWIELYNTTGLPINIGGWFLSDSDADDPNRMKYRIPDGMSIDGYGFVVFFEDLHFNNPANPDARIPFALSENGETLVLSSASGEVLTGYRDREEFDASPTGVAFGRYYKASTDSWNFVLMSQNTPGWENAYPLVGPIVINEIMYNPISGNQDEEYIELHNITGSAVTLFDTESSLPWKFTDGIDLTFPSGSPLTIPGYGYVLIVKDQTAFAAKYGSAPAGVTVLEWDSGNLDNGGEKVEISMPGDVDSYGNRYYIRIDRVNYSDGSHPEGSDPWPIGPDGYGASLSRIAPEDYGNDPANWKAGTPTPGLVNP